MDTTSSPDLDRYLALVLRHLASGARTLVQPSAFSEDLSAAYAKLPPDVARQADAIDYPFVLEDPEFTTGRPELDALLSATVGLCRNPNMDGGLDWHECLVAVLEQLPPTQADRSKQVAALRQAHREDPTIVGQAFRQLLSDPVVNWHQHDDTDFLPRVVHILAQQPALEPSDRDHGAAFLKVLGAPDRIWQETSVAPLLNEVAERTAELSTAAPRASTSAAPRP